MKKLLLILFICVLGIEIRAQYVPPQPDTLFVAADTLSIQEVINKKPHSPHKATILALALPGAGQIYNKKGWWWKLPILYGGVGATVYGLSWNSKQFKKYKTAFIDYTLYIEAKAEDPDLPYPQNPSWDKVYIGGGVENFTPQQQLNFQTQLKNKKDSFKRNRDLLYITMGAIYAIQVIEACVSAHFYDFEINEDLSFNVQPNAFYTTANGNSVGLTLTLNF